MRYQYWRNLVSAVVFVWLVAVPAVRAQGEGKAGILESLDIAAAGTLDFYSSYVWRGFTLDKDPVVQPSLSLSSKGFTFTFWSSWDTDNNDALDSDEIDLVVDYTKSFDILSLSAGHTYYDFPGTNGYSREFYVGAGLSEVPFLELPITSSLRFYRDYGDQNDGGGLGNYTELALGYSKVLSEDKGISLDLGTAIGYNHKLFITGDGGQATFRAGMTLPLTKSLTMKPNVNYTIPFADLSKGSDGDQDQIFWGGFSLVYSFS
jgi:hypothetical protein